jgi:hypothetical protein
MSRHVSRNLLLYVLNFAGAESEIGRNTFGFKSRNLKMTCSTDRALFGASLALNQPGLPYTLMHSGHNITGRSLRWDIGHGIMGGGWKLTVQGTLSFLDPLVKMSVHLLLS